MLVNRTILSQMPFDELKAIRNYARAVKPKDLKRFFEGELTKKDLHDLTVAATAEMLSRVSRLFVSDEEIESQNQERRAKVQEFAKAVGFKGKLDAEEQDDYYLQLRNLNVSISKRKHLGITETITGEGEDEVATYKISTRKGTKDLELVHKSEYEYTDKVICLELALLKLSELLTGREAKMKVEA